MSNKKKQFTTWEQMEVEIEKHNEEMEKRVPELPFPHTFTISSDGSLCIEGSNVLNPYEAFRLASALYAFYVGGADQFLGLEELQRVQEKK